MATETRRIDQIALIKAADDVLPNVLPGDLIEGQESGGSSFQTTVGALLRSASDGDVNAPGFAFAGEHDTGLHRAGAGDVRFALLGADIMAWQGAGITSLVDFTVDKALTVNGAFTSVGIDDNATSTVVTIDSAGRLLVGGQSSAIDSGFYSTVSIGGSTVTGTSGYLEFRRRSDGEQGAAIFINAAQNAELLYNVADSTSQAAHIFQIDAVEAMRIDSNQQVGIGTSSPGSNLDVQRSTDGFAFRVRQSTSGDQIEIGQFNPYSYIRATSAPLYLQTVGANALLLGTNSAEAMRIDSSQKVGVGNANPFYKFDVLGSGAVSMRTRSIDSEAEVRIEAAPGKNSRLTLGDNSGPASVQITGNSNRMLFFTATIEAMRIDAAQNTTIRGDLIVDSLAGTGTRDVQVLADGTLIAI